MKKPFVSFKHAFRGIRDFICSETNAKIQILAAIAMLALGFFLEFSVAEWIAVVLCIGLVLSAEAMNTAIEELADEVSIERKESLRRVKDIAAGAVLIASITALAVAVLIVFTRL